ncbi:hypothetical protein [Reticulibacter mediterranei]|uniref:hypothetical protein n=1 Tax=Reticulibacter mediterranei TaxID=2778369 RepID=UPI001C6921DC|nr:hypothetical protein [Reticulibacter mediterranei]
MNCKGCPEISQECREELAQRRIIQVDIEQGIYPFGGMVLTQAEIEWLCWSRMIMDEALLIGAMNSNSSPSRAKPREHDGKDRETPKPYVGIENVCKALT